MNKSIKEIKERQKNEETNRSLKESQEIQEKTVS